MHPARPSQTALRVALRRAAHQLYDPAPLVFPDPLAVPILGQQYLPDLHKTATKLSKPFSIALRALLVARSRYAEDLLAKAVVAGVTQYVLLGAGLDTFAYRNPHPTLRVFEVDHPATQQWKHNLLAAANIPIPSSLTYTPIDFEQPDPEQPSGQDPLATQLRAAGFNPNAPTFFAWLGVVPYLTLPAFRSTLAFIASCPPGSGLVLDYAQPRAVLPFFEQLAHDSLADRVKRAGEPFQLFFTPAELAAELAAFHHLEDLGSPQINALYFDHHPNPEPHPLRAIGSAPRILSAWL
jgi:methyltransferase (TIGR00027 family)